MVKVYISALYCADCETCHTHNRYIEPCPDCGLDMKWKSVLKHGPNDPNVQIAATNIAYKDNERVSMSLSVPVGQFEETRKMHPGVEWRKIGNSMCPVIHNRPEKLRIMKQAGYAEYPPNYFNQMHGSKGTDR